MSSCAPFLASRRSNPGASSVAVNEITVFVNGEKQVVRDVDPNASLQEFLASTGNTGTKLSCGQGACGACTVNLARAVGGQVEEFAVNACLRPLVLCDGCSITTTEGLGTASKLHPVQERIACMNGSQCGFCTPGQVMSMYSLLRENQAPTPQEVEACLEGNICRCTGYRAIHAAFHTFAGKEACTDVPGYPKQFASYSRDNDPSFPKELLDFKPKPLLCSANGNDWHRVLELNAWATLCAAAGSRKPRVVVGNTSVGVFGQKLGSITNIDVSSVPDLAGVTKSGDGISFGGAESLSKVVSTLKDGNSAQQTLAGSLSKIANNNIRNAGGWAGNLVMGRVPQFPSDGMVLLAAFGATLTVAFANAGQVTRKQMSVADYLQHSSLNDSNYLLLSLHIPNVTCQFHAFRQAISKVNNHALVNSAFSTNLNDGKFDKPVIVFGCIGSRSVIATKAMEFLQGKPVEEATLRGVIDIVRETVKVERDLTYETSMQPEGKVEFKRQVVLSFIFKWFVSLTPAVAPALRSLVAEGGGFWAARDDSMSVAQEMKSTAQLSLPEGHPGQIYVGPKLEAYEQATGQMRYSGDMNMGPKGSYGVWVSAKQVGMLAKIDSSLATNMEGVIAVVDHSSVPGLNSCSFVPAEEPLFASPDSPIHYCGQKVALVVASTLAQAKAAARVVKVQVNAPAEPPIFTLDDALAKKSFLYGPDVPGKVVTIGDPTGAFADPALVIAEGDFNLGGQNHFYMEKQTAIAFPEDMGRIGIYGGTQGPDVTKTMVMLALGCSSKDIVVQNRPMGGAFGGKFTKQIPVFCAAAVACKATGRPVRVATDIESDMGQSGHTRHIVKCHYKVAATKEGRIIAINTRCVIDAGFGNDYTDYIADEILKRQDNVYNVQHYRAEVVICKTNNASCTPVRAPGLAQAAAISETLVEAIARKIGVTYERVAELSFKQIGQARDQTGQAIPEWNIPQMWNLAKTKYDFNAREQACADFNSANKFKKRAIALMPLKYAVGYINLSGATVTVNINAVDGSVAIQTGCCEMGQGCLSKVVSACASEFGIGIDKVSAFYPNTSVLPNLTTDGGSAGAEVLCHATKMACQKLKETLKAVEQQLIAEKRERGEEPTASWVEVCNRAQGPMPTDTRTLLSATAQHKVPKWNDLARSSEHPPPQLPFWNLDPAPKETWQYYQTSVACSEVEVDVTTGSYVVLRVDLLCDAGHSLNPLLDLGQAEGGFVYGMGTYLQEDVLISPTDGSNKCQGTWNYKPPNNKDVPQVFNCELLPGNPSSRTAYGSKGLGEPPLLLAYSVATALKKAILASRVERGLGSDFTLNSPATVDRVQQCMELNSSHLSLA